MGNMDIDNVERFIRKQKIAFICSVDEEGYPNVKANRSLTVKGCCI